METRVERPGRILLGLVLATSLSSGTSLAQGGLDPCAPVASCPNDSRSRVPPPPPEPARPRSTQSRSSAGDCPRNAAGEPICHDERPGDGDGDTLLAVAGIAAALIGGAILVDQLTGDDFVKPQELDANGPRFPNRQALGRFQVQGYAAAGWPFAVDLQTVPGAVTWLELRYKGGNKPLRVDIPPGPERRMAVLTLPGPRKPGVGIARYSIHSAIPDGDRMIYQPLRIHGIGAGPYAVGSLYLSVGGFSPGRIAVPSQARYTVRSARIFPRAKLEVLQLPAKGKNKLDLINSQTVSLTHNPLASNWGAMQFRKPPGPGAYQLQVRAWRDSPGEKDWTGALAPDYAIISGRP